MEDDQRMTQPTMIQLGHERRFVVIKAHAQSAGSFTMLRLLKEEFFEEFWI
jgi:hypothetical protein